VRMDVLNPNREAGLLAVGFKPMAMRQHAIE
jgi:hypothetical protein